MTAQIQDRVYFIEREYVLTGVKGADLPTPAQFDMQPTMISTACYRGYYLTYACLDGALYLTDLTLRAKDDVYTPIAGVTPFIDSDYQVARYTGLKLKVPFTGGLLIATDFIGSMYVHMGFQKPTSYRRVIELLFDAGDLRSAVDYSEQIGQMRVNNRSRVRAGRPEEISGWLNRMFSLDYEV